MDGVRRWRDSGSDVGEQGCKRARLEAVAEYAESLRDLTFSSKPIINSLTMIADENRLNAPQIAEAINIRALQVCVFSFVATFFHQPLSHTRHPKQLPADSRLPVLYLMDSIVKNVHDPYATIFTQYADNLFIDTYRRACLPETQRALLHLHATGRDEFPPRGRRARPHTRGRA